MKHFYRFIRQIHERPWKQADEEHAYNAGIN